MHNPELIAAAEAAADTNATMYAGGWAQLLNYSFPEQGTTPAANASFTTIQNIGVTQRAFIPANSLQQGAQLLVKAWGTYGSAAGTATTIMSLYLNGTTGTVICASASQTPPTSTVNVFTAEAMATILTIGSSGTMNTAGLIHGLGTTTTTPILWPATLPAAATVNTTQANSIQLAASWSASASGNTYTVYGFDVLQLN
jgi:hypothetical protein